MLATISLPTAAPAAEEASAAPAAAPAEETPATAPVEKPPVVDYQDVPSFGGPNSAGAQLRSDSAALEQRKGNVLLRPYYAFKGWLNGQAGLAFGADYAFMWQYGAPSLDERTGAGGVFRFYGNWALLGRGTKLIGFAVNLGARRRRPTGRPCGTSSPSRPSTAFCSSSTWR